MILSGTISQSRFFENLELKTVDLRFRSLGNQEVASQDIVIVEIDDYSIEQLEGDFGRWPWPRLIHGYFVRYMRNAGAKAIGYDIMFQQRNLSDQEGDLFFAEESKKAGNVIHSIFLGNQDLGMGEEEDPNSVHLLNNSIPSAGSFMSFIQADFPYSELASSTRNLGHVANVLDSDGPLRNYLLLADHEGRSIPSFALSIAMSVQGKNVQDIQVSENGVVQVGNIRTKLNRNWRLPIWFNGGPGSYPTFSYSNIVYSQNQIEMGEEPGIDPNLFRGKIVMIGATAQGLFEMFTTPFSGSSDESSRTSSGLRLGKMSGVEIHAHVVDDLLNNRYLIYSPAWLNILTLGLVILSVLFLTFRTGILYAFPGAIALILIYYWIVNQAFSHRTHMPIIEITIGWLSALVTGIAYQYWVEGKEKRRIKGIFSKYVSRDVFSELMNDPEAARLGGQRSLVTVLFTDLRGFTSMSENREPEDIVAQLNEYFSAMVKIVFKNKGTVDKFVGDMVMALFSAPLPDALHADHAVQCAIDMQRELEVLNREWEKRGLPKLACGAGINSGEMIAGNVGSESIQSYTVIGDNVNLGARLESLCKQYSVDIIISEFTKNFLQNDYQIEALDEVKVKGKSKPVKIFKVGY
jgi:adenylate cyclase